MRLPILNFYNSGIFSLESANTELKPTEFTPYFHICSEPKMVLCRLQRAKNGSLQIAASTIVVSLSVCLSVCPLLGKAEMKC